MNGVRWGLGLKRVYSLFPLQCISGLESTLTALHNEGRRGCLLHSSPKAFIHCQVSGHHVSQHEYPDHSTVVFCWIIYFIYFFSQMSKLLHRTVETQLLLYMGSFAAQGLPSIIHTTRGLTKSEYQGEKINCKMIMNLTEVNRGE